MIRKRKVPMRRDVISNEMKPKREMVRIVRTPDGNVTIDTTGKKSGRGAYVSLEPALIKKAQTNKSLDAALGVSVDPAFYDELFAYVDHQKARQELFGKTY